MSIRIRLRRHPEIARGVPNQRADSQLRTLRCQSRRAPGVMHSRATEPGAARHPAGESELELVRLPRGRARANRGDRTCRRWSDCVDPASTMRSLRAGWIMRVPCSEASMGTTKLGRSKRGSSTCRPPERRHAGSWGWQLTSRLMFRVLYIKDPPDDSDYAQERLRGHGDGSQMD